SATDLSLGTTLTVTTSGGLGASGAASGNEGRFITGANTTLTMSALNNITDKGVEHYSGPTDTNPYLSGTPQTPTIQGIPGGADSYGILDAAAARPAAGQTPSAPQQLLASALDYDLSTGGTQAPQQDALVAVMRMPAGVGAASQTYAGYDLLVIANVSTSI